jgi:hypothetical protein
MTILSRHPHTEDNQKKELKAGRKNNAKDT